MAIDIASLTIVPEPDTTARDREKVADLIPVAVKIQEAKARVQFVLEEAGANKEIERLRLAARFQGYSLRTVGREAGSKPGTVLVTVKAGKLIEKGKGTDAATEATEAPAESAPTASAPEVPTTVATVTSPKPGKSATSK